MKKSRLTEKMWAKVTAFILLVIFIIATVLSALGAAAIIALGVYYQDIESVKSTYIYRGRSPGWREMLYTYDDLGVDGLDDLFSEYLMCYVKIENATTGKVIVEYGEENHNYRVESDSFRCEIYSYNGGEDYALDDTIKVTRHYDFSPENLETNTMLYIVDKAIDAAYVMKFWIYPIALSCLVIAIALFVFLMRSSGRREGCDGVRAGWGTKVPFDLLFAATVVAISFILNTAFGNWWWIYSYPIIQIISTIVSFIIIPIFVVGLCMSFALRVKLGAWWKNTIIYMIINGIARLVRILAKLICKLFVKIPLIWKSAFIILGITFIEFLFIVFNMYEGDNILVFWFVEKVLTTPALLYFILCLKKLQQGAEEIANGKLGNRIDKKYLIGDMKEHAFVLDRIGHGIDIAVEERMKSERMKTELITNVSHDIKTPLTSIINYSDLISKETTENEKISEYSLVLLRQSERLKRLIDDLVEASKASTGNIEIIAEPFDLGVLFSQTTGEYEEKLTKNELTLITKQPEEPVHIMADGRRMWRIFDNLMNNICKYAQSGTRVYLTLEKVGNEAVISFKNTSRDALDVPADELLERFTRGDASRNTEGNGLGLSIAKSLAELQNGELNITVDGDLFKVVLHFPLI